MSYDLKIDKKKDMLWITATGNRTLETVLAITRDCVAACITNKTTKLLIDVCKLEGRLKTLDAYNVADQYFPKIEDLNIITQCAIIDLKEFEESYRFFENVAVNRGFNLRIFSDPDEAIAWLKKPPI